MERPDRPTGNTALYETQDYRIELVQLTGPDIAAFNRIKYAVVHKVHGVTAGVTEQFPGAISAAVSLQQLLDEALEGKTIPGSKKPSAVIQ